MSRTSIVKPGRRGRQPAFGAVLLLAAGLALSACTTRIDTGGFIPEHDLVSQIEVGKDNVQFVYDLLGTPSASSNFPIEGKQTWFYIMRKTRQVSFFDEEVLAQDVLAVEFNQDGIVNAINRYDKSAANAVDLVERATPTRGREFTFMEQILGNVRRVTSGDSFGRPGRRGQ